MISHLKKKKNETLQCCQSSFIQTKQSNFHIIRTVFWTKYHGNRYFCILDSCKFLWFLNFMQSTLACTTLPGIPYQHRDHHSSPVLEPSTRWLSPHQPNDQSHFHPLLRLPGRREPSSNQLFLFWRSCSSSHEPGTASEKGRWLAPSWEKYWESSASELTDPCWSKVTLVTSCPRCIKPLPACEHHTDHSYCYVNKGIEDLSVYWEPNCWNWMSETLHINTFLANAIIIKGFQIPLLCRRGSVEKQGMKLFTFAVPFIHVLREVKVLYLHTVSMGSFALTGKADFSTAMTIQRDLVSAFCPQAQVSLANFICVPQRRSALEVAGGGTPQPSLPCSAHHSQSLQSHWQTGACCCHNLSVWHKKQTLLWSPCDREGACRFGFELLDQARASVKAEFEAGSIFIASNPFTRLAGSKKRFIVQLRGDEVSPCLAFTLGDGLFCTAPVKHRLVRCQKLKLWAI